MKKAEKKMLEHAAAPILVRGATTELKTTLEEMAKEERRSMGAQALVILESAAASWRKAKAARS